MTHPNFSDQVNENLDKAETSGVFITSLEKGDVLKIFTDESNYTFTVIDPQKAIVRAEGGGFKKGGEEVFFAGSNWGGSMLKMRWAGPDTRIEAGELVLPWTNGMTLNGKVIMSSTGVQ